METTGTPTTKESPKGPLKKRIESLDIIRGFIILGIFIININYFSTITIERYHPTVHGNFNWLNQLIWVLEYTLVKQRLMTVFAILFGAGIYLMAKHNKNKGLKEAPLHFTRMFWLVIIGLIHAYLIWDGDILVSYALCGCVVYFLRNMSAKALIIIGTIMILIPFWGTFKTIVVNEPVPKEDLAFWNPDNELLQEALQSHQVSWTKETPGRIKTAFRRQTSDFITWSLWRVGGLMLLGMALMKLDVLTAKRPKKTYTRMLLVSAGIGLPISFYGTLFYMKSNYDFSVFIGLKSATFYFGGLILGFSYIALLILLVKSDGFKYIKKSFSALGKMALTNYIMQSVFGTLIFFGYGLGYWGKVDRTFLVLVILAVWVFQAIFSNYWMKHYNYGPLEWLWRSLIYRKKQPLKRNQL